MRMIQPLAQEMPVIGVFHQPEMTAKYCTRVIAIKKGRIIYDGDPRLTTDQLVDIYGEELQQIENAPVLAASASGEINCINPNDHERNFF
jgi:phosphonate transport system ATP-binding protein